MKTVDSMYVFNFYLRSLKETENDNVVTLNLFPSGSKKRKKKFVTKTEKQEHKKSKNF